MQINPSHTIIPVLVLMVVGINWPLIPRAQDNTPLTVKQIPFPPEKNPPGDIPDTQVFVEYQSALGFSLKIPEGWAQRVTQDSVTFTNAYDGVAVQVSPSTSAPSIKSATTYQAAMLKSSPAAVRISKIVAVRLPAGAAIRISFASNSERNAVTGKAIRLENDQYLIWKNGRLATLTLSAPFGADNVDQWRLMAHSFQWR